METIHEWLRRHECGNTDPRAISAFVAKFMDGVYPPIPTSARRKPG